MPAEFQNALDFTIIGVKNRFCFLDVILIVGKGSEDDNKYSFVAKYSMRKILELIFLLPLCKREIGWLGFHILKSEESPIKNQQFFSLEAQKTLKKTSFFSWLSTLHLNFITNFAQISYPLRPLSLKSAIFYELILMKTVSFE